MNQQYSQQQGGMGMYNPNFQSQPQSQFGTNTQMNMGKNLNTNLNQPYPGSNQFTNFKNN